ncbi:hypothetical protein [Heyndrickxia sporothermodurans]|uniref:Uncharacterized protein n=1 Tax=Heyndrickxia sporothermodurans TaxID=46224 RepID=A0AB37H7R1_9BACI|nr:hypothetical protein [Heyndrickxia sporothermodurans]MBL5767625.1 hypothetical protein [Heyndrickxia sporothermodurans]MBL5771128.1 hypothetical protein [Heyndrickxia sporothermodurans]MBL5775374.1 hypothetical protein [Heyndrickxia sporothermodurans]MBL5778325.1 hypothetical protein [Heyndrickxia sporothermodurans]MBL5782348.1 hypothetical protein [Heyndrickxia sporothermodurans]
MGNIQLKLTKNNDCKNGTNGYKIIEVNVSDPTDSLFAVVTPIKKQ